MRNKCKLILVEGLCGTGKSTLAERLHDYLVQQGIPSKFYDEGAQEHPTSLNWHAFFREEEYNELLLQNPDYADVIRSLAVKYGLNYLIPYRHGIANQIAALNPVVIYLTQPDVREQQTWISTIRSRPNFATEQNIKFMENRKRIELRLLEVLPFSTCIIENKCLDWEEVLSKMVEAI
ncbi:hypothetical protein ASG89_21125 [Paenibacillus sp. Soil766]|uniref:hypothetical protein n=1 Tax=Paenibacillus sp. Soil766 TaxID=1736404 RepID=UPI00070B4C60|nr:hypothetical protein [Paenibacillus sp. Soil766]KRF04807.1 hypothetical protein ASG89_21125 [Paenibacillus sp. Soil766]